MRNRNTRALAIALVSLGLLAASSTPSAHAQSTRSQATYQLPSRIVNVHLLYAAKHESDGSITYSFGSRNIQGHPHAFLVYVVNANNPSFYSAQETANQFEENAGKSIISGGDVETYGDDSLWGVTENNDDDACRSTVGFPWHRAAVTVTAYSTDQSDCTWTVNYVFKIVRALKPRIP